MEWLQTNNVVPKERLDENLRQLALAAQQYLPSSGLRQQTLNNLFTAIINSKQLWYPQKDQFHEFYKEVYQEAQQNLWLYVCQNIEKYNPELGSVMGWINMLLCRRFYKEAKTKFTDKRLQNVSDWDTLANNFFPIESSTLVDMLQEYIELDPEEIFKHEHIKNCPDANFQALLKLRLSGYLWKDISAKFGIKIGTLTSFYKRRERKFILKFQKYLHIYN